MSTFDKTFLFLRAHNGGVEDIDRMHAAGFQGLFCNIGDPSSPPEAWDVIRQRAAQEGMFCGPWLRVEGDDRRISLNRLDFLIRTARWWKQPYVINAEKELDGTEDRVTGPIAILVNDDDCAISMEARLFANVDWTPVGHIPFLLQLFPESGMTNPAEMVQLAHDYGIKCVYATYASYGGRKPGDYDLVEPYSIYTADDCKGNYAAWSPTMSGYQGCLEELLEKIGSQHGIDGFMKWVRSLPSVPPRGPNYDANKIDTWPWPDKLERTLKILARDHDEGA